MNVSWMLILTLFCSSFALDAQGKHIEIYHVSSPILTKIIETTIDSSRSRMNCDVVECLYVEIEAASKQIVRVETLRSPSLNIILKRDTSLIVGFYMGETLCFADIGELLSSGLITDIKKVGELKLSDISFEYSCLDIEFKGDIYYTIVYLRFSVEDGVIELEHDSIFVDAGDVDISEALKERGIPN